jgi:hypothetical protein
VAFQVVAFQQVLEFQRYGIFIGPCPAHPRTPEFATCSSPVPQGLAVPGGVLAGRWPAPSEGAVGTTPLLNLYLLTLDFGCGAFRPEQSGGGAFRPEQSGGGAFRPEQSGGGAFRPEQSGSGAFRPEQSGSGAFRPEQSGSGAFRPEQSGGGAGKGWEYILCEWTYRNAVAFQVVAFQQVLEFQRFGGAAGDGRWPWF